MPASGQSIKGEQSERCPNCEGLQEALDARIAGEARIEAELDAVRAALEQAIRNEQHLRAGRDEARSEAAKWRARLAAWPDPDYERIVGERDRLRDALERLLDADYPTDFEDGRDYWPAREAAREALAEGAER